MRDQEIDMVLAHPKPALAQPFVPWRSRVSEPERLRELEGFLAGAFDTFREVGIEWQFQGIKRPDRPTRDPNRPRPRCCGPRVRGQARSLRC